MRRLLPVLLGVVVVIGGGILLLTVVHGRDAAGVDAQAGAGPGVLEPNRGNATRAGAGVGRFSAPAPTSGTHAPRNPRREGRVDDAELLQALALGDVALVYASARPPAELVALQGDVSGAFDPELAAAGQMVLLVRRAGTRGIQALSWRRRLQATGPRDPRLRAFAEAWLGQGVGRTR